ncbi:MAG TPA: hypothetical protein VFT22_37410 [Kofleriaceae bacterium]|nr:hypothetical protein [Kofleriaceae bacterium]
MDEFEPGAGAVDPPLKRIVAVHPARRYRRTTRLSGLSGIVLFACMFLPAVDACGQPVMPYEMPPFWPPYLYGLAFALIALAARPRGLRRGIVTLRVLTVGFVIGSVLVIPIVPEVGIAELAIALALLMIVGVSRTTERRVATAAIVVGAASTLWFAVWAFTEEARYGVYLSLAGGCGLLAGSLVWLRGLARHPRTGSPAARPPPAPLE